MKKVWRLAMAAVPLTGLIVIGALFFGAANDPREKRQTYEISVIIRGPQNQYWDSVKLGMDEAAYDMNVDLTFETLLDYNNAAEQLSVLKRELDNNAQAIILAPVSAGVYPLAAAYKADALLIEIESDTGAGSLYTSVHPDNAKIGYDIGCIVADAYAPGQKLVLVRDNAAAPYMAEREAGFYRALEEKGLRPLVWSSDKTAVMTQEEIKSKVILENAHMLVALDAVNLYNTAAAISSAEGIRAKVFGADCTDEIVAFLESGVIDSTVAKNAFNMGYLSVQSAVGALNKTEPPDDPPPIEHTVATVDNIYSKSIEHIIFPIVK